MSSSIRLKGRQALKNISSTLDLRRVGRKPRKGIDFEYPKGFARQETHGTLSTIFMAVLMRDEEDVYLEDEVTSDLCITLCDLQLEDDGSANQDGSIFFSPMSSDDLKSFPFDESDGATKRFLRAYDCWDESKPTTTGIRIKRTAGSLIGELTWLVGGCQRTFPEGDKKTYLHRAVNWKN
ncbi:hypothetical protein Plec18170_009741, partial [Paecilomyces lecythidis]